MLMFRLRKNWFPVFLSLPCLLLFWFYVVKRQDSMLGFIDLNGFNSFEREGTYYFPFSSKYKKSSGYSYKKLLTNNHDFKPDDTISHHNLNNLVTDPNALKNEEHILILTQIEEFSIDYWNNLIQLTYPRNLIDLGFIVKRNAKGDKSLKLLQNVITAFQTNSKNTIFNKITILRENESKEILGDGINSIIEARKQSAVTRNELLFSTLGPKTSWILWLDSQIIETPKSLIEDLTSHGKAILTVNIYQKNADESGKSTSRPYEQLNKLSWQSSQDWVETQHRLDDKTVIINGISNLKTGRNTINQFKDDNDITFGEIELDSVSAGCTLVKSDVHRDGAMFPNFPFYNLIDTEGFTKMAKRLNYKAFGLPNYLVFHA